MPRIPEIQTGCWSSLLPFIGKPRRGPVVPDANPTKEVHRDSESRELPPYQHLYGWDGWENTSGSTRSSAEKPPAYTVDDGLPSRVVQVIEDRLKELSPNLRQLSLDIWNHPETAFKEKYAHDRLTDFMASHGFSVTPHYLGLSTAWRAEFTHRSPKKSGRAQDPLRVIGINSEMDALPSIGHGCGHNLIAMSGAAVAVAIKAALEKYDVPGVVVLLGTPAEETRGGKTILLERGAYEGMDACIMCHPSSGPDNFTALGPGVARQPVDVEFFGHGAHAAAAPWEAQNALDAAFVAYASISALRQQIKPDHRVHGIILGRDWTPNVIPDYAKMRYYVRAPTWTELEALRGRVTACFQAAALATGCTVEVKAGAGYFEVRNNNVLGQEFFRVVESQYAMRTNFGEGAAYSTDFGNITYALPALHPIYSIPTETNGSNHTSQFAKSAATPEAHEATLKVALGLATTGFKILHDAEFTSQVREAFESSKARSSMSITGV
ncbi:amidohydrolase [Dichomitus squalens]|uniref:Amidohydrolase n=1 Tax=Dichomitus squalens TaxID=114155 RepID=A0A4Q9MD54_9APHY|nr:amidohydrolase [Dichomitus squalens]